MAITLALLLSATDIIAFFLMGHLKISPDTRKPMKAFIGFLVLAVGSASDFRTNVEPLLEHRGKG